MSINKPTIKDEYDFDFILSASILEPLQKPCHDCAVVCGLYTELTHELAKKSLQYQHDISIRWDCHNHRTRACRGNIDLLKQLNNNNNNGD